MSRKDINLILSIIESHPNLIRRQLFEMEVLDVDKDAVVNSLSKDSYFTKGAVRSLVNDLCMALETTRRIDIPIVRDGCSYYGEWNHGKPHGKGVLIDVLGNFICGRFKNGRLNTGIKIWSNGITIHGLFEQHRNSSRLYYGFNLGTIVSGSIYLENGTRFEGEFDENEPYNGKMIYHNGDCFVGDVVPVNTDYYDGDIELLYGILNYKDGKIFKGWFDNNLPDEGEMTWPTGEHFDGRFSNSLPRNGRLDYPDGSFYEGKFENGEYCGHGVLETNNESCEGDFYNSDLIYGHIHMMDGCEYIGDCKNYLPNGKGTWIFPDGSQIGGYFSNGLLHDSLCFYDLSNIASYGDLDELSGLDIDELPFDDSDELVNSLTEDLDFTLKEETEKMLGTQKLYNLHERSILENDEDDIINYYIEDGSGLIDEDEIYLGDIEQGLPNGTGIRFKFSGLVESGNFDDGSLDGMDESYVDTNEIYEGEFRNGVPDGRLSWKSENRSIDGIFVNGNLDSIIDIDLPSSFNVSISKMELEFYFEDLKNLISEGCGIHYFVNGRPYQYFKKYSKPATLFDSYGIFFGNLLNGYPDGYGIYISDELSAEGVFKNGTLVGIGHCKYFDDREYDGEFNSILKNDEKCVIKPHGYGIMYYPDGQIDEGLFDNGVIREGFRFINKTEIYRGRFDEYGNIPDCMDQIELRLELMETNDEKESGGENSIVPFEYIEVYNSALSGNWNSMLFIADCFYSGINGFEQSMTSARRWYKKALTNMEDNYY